ncbi:MAG: RNA 2',3'-cyclic phosphodiesterase [Candidatus Eisenbacteria bacterium]|uniref:RNA 2',3'-cyclic phosphodiesterase n=1 Tax=Eiseniibacteriota bacterium TaxID=2212470 RepID=A0A538U1L8_UNCEI|nr:MAG: RNA 2',3'-cyclic phosphodiesterase [Candidatus Eisenbacteria bacterium]
MRIFLAVFPSPGAQGVAAAAIERLRRPGDGVSWVKRENLHYTLRFMGELGASGLKRVVAAAREGVADHRRFEAALGSAGAFPDAARARVLWLGLSVGGEALVALARSVEEALRRRGFERADHAFTAHLTIGRVRIRDQDWGPRLSGVSLEADPLARFVVDTVAVVESTLSPKGSRYEARAEAILES